MIEPVSSTAAQKLDVGQQINRLKKQNKKREFGYT